MTDEETCPRCGKQEFMVLLDVVSTHVCVCGCRWLPQSLAEKYLKLLDAYNEKKSS